MDALSPSHPCEQVVLMSGAQLGKTSILENFIGYIIDLDPGPVLLVQPREADCKAFSKDRLAPMLRDCGTLRGKVADVRSRDSNNTILHKRFTGGSITMSAASSPAGLAMRSIRYCLLDEVDRYPASAGSEGDPVNLAITRTANFWNRKIALCSTPTVKGASRIEAAWLESNQQMYWVPCPHCGTHQVLHWASVEWPEGDPEKAQYRCEHCGQMIGEHQKSWMVKHGERRAAHRACCVDSGYESQAVYDFCRTRCHRRIFAVKGQGGPHPVWPKKPTAKNIRGERPWMVGSDSAKATIMGRLRNAQLGTPGFSHFPAGRQQPHFEQLLGEALVTTYSKGQPVRQWHPKRGVRHEALDARVYDFGALRALVSMGLVLDAEADPVAATGAPAGEQRPALARIRHSHWMGGE
jgi:phage terminase large subunit GpA-like protein